MLDNTMTLDWEEQLPAMMKAYNCHVQRATHETPFFLTYLHSPRLPYFDLEKPRLLYGEDWSSLAFTKMQTAFRQVKDNLESARDAREKYFNQKTKDRSFKVGDCVLVKFPNAPRGVNPKFYKKWKGVFRVTKVVGRLNLLVQLTVASKPILVHVDRVRHLTLSERETAFDSKLPKGDEVDFTDSSDSETEDRVSTGARAIQHHDQEQDFSEYVDVPEEGDEIEDNAEPGEITAPRLTRADARRRGVPVEDVPLPRHCHASKRGRNK